MSIAQKMKVPKKCVNVSGEMALFTGEPRSATILALRDSVVVKVTKEAFEEMIRRHPTMVINIAKLIIQRLKRLNLAEHLAYKVVNICLVPISKHLDWGSVARRIAAELKQHGKVLLLDAATVDGHLHRKGLAQVAQSDQERYQHLLAWLDEMEAQHDFVLYIADDHLSEWTKKCIRQADEILLAADAGSCSALSPVESWLAKEKEKTPQISQTLLLVHREGGANVSGGASRWLENRMVKFHHHLRWDVRQDFKRLGRFLSGKAVGLVLSGGGAKGMAHIGVYRALKERGVEFDLVGGTSIGSVIGAFIAQELSPEEIYERNRAYFLNNPTPVTDFNLLPIISFMKGKKLDRLLRQVFGDQDLEDLWINFFCVSSNLTQTRAMVHRRGLLRQALRASISLPGIFPPVICDNEILVDGGIFDNLPIGVMGDLGIARIIAVDLDVKADYALPENRMPSSWRVLAEKLFTRRPRLKVPTIMSTIIQTSTIYSELQARRYRSEVGLYFHPDVRKFGLMDWKKFDEIVEVGYRHACEVLDRWEGF